MTDAEANEALPVQIEQAMTAAAKAVFKHPSDVREALFQLRKVLAVELSARPEAALQAEIEVWKTRALEAEAVVERVRLYVSQQVQPKAKSNGRH